MYEALRAYFVDDRPSGEVARAFGYTTGSFQVLCHHFRRDSDPVFFTSTRPGPRSQPKSDAARDLRSEEHTSELQSPCNIVCRLLLEKKKRKLLKKAWAQTTITFT